MDDFQRCKRMKIWRLPVYEAGAQGFLSACHQVGQSENKKIRHLKKFTENLGGGVEIHMKNIRRAVQLCLIGLMVYALYQISQELQISHMRSEETTIYWGILGYELLLLASGFGVLFTSGKTKFKQPSYNEG